MGGAIPETPTLRPSGFLETVATPAVAPGAKAGQRRQRGRSKKQRCQGGVGSPAGRGAGRACSRDGAAHPPERGSARDSGVAGSPPRGGSSSCSGGGGCAPPAGCSLAGAPLTSGLLRLFGELAQRGGKAGGRRGLGRQRTAGGGAAAGHQGAIERRGGEGVDGGGGPGRGGKHP